MIRGMFADRICSPRQYPIRLVLNGLASKEIEWHCKHYVGRKLMKRFESGEDLAKEMGLKPEVLKKTFEAYNTSATTKQDPFGKKACIIYELSVLPLTSPHAVLLQRSMDYE